MSPRAGLDRRGKSRPPPGFDPPTVKPVASDYTVYAARSTHSQVIWVKYIPVYMGRDHTRWQSS